jgi:hypothetical protein
MICRLPMANHMLAVTSITIFAVGFTSCNQGAVVTETQVERQGPLHVRHEFQTIITKAGWKTQIWLDATLYFVSEPLNVGVRLTPPKDLDRPPPAKLVIRVLQVTADKVIREATTTLAWKDCSSMEKGREVLRSNKEFGEIGLFPPKEKCWQATVEDAFKSEDDPKNRFEPDRYRVAIELVLDDQPPIFFNAISIEFRHRKK